MRANAKGVTTMAALTEDQKAALLAALRAKVAEIAAALAALRG